MNPEEALADLMSIIDIGERRDLVARDIGSDRRYACVDRLSLALVLAVPFGLDRNWRRLRRYEFPESFTSASVIGILKDAGRSLAIIDHFELRMGKSRFQELVAQVEAFQDGAAKDISFQFTYDELNQIDELMAVGLGQDLGGEIFWSYDSVKTPSGAELKFIFSMLNRKQLIGCVEGPYDESDELDPEDLGLTDLDD